MKEYVRKEKIKLMFDLLMKKILAFICVAGFVAFVYYIIWDRFTNNDVLYLYAWYLITGVVITMFIYATIDEAIDSYRVNRLKGIKSRANKRFKKGE